MWGQVCSGKTLAYNPTGSGAGVDQFIAKQVDFAGSDSALKDDQVAKAAAALRRQPGVEPAAGVRPGRDGLQHRRRRQAGRQRRRARQDLPGPDQEVERPGHRRAEQRRHPARRRHQADLPVGLVGHHRQLPEVPGRRRAGDVDQGRRQGVPGRRRRGRAEVVRCRAGHPGHPRCDRLRREEPGAAGGPAVRADRQRRRCGRADRRVHRQGASPPPSSRPRARTWRWTWTRCTPPRKPAPTR